MGVAGAGIGLIPAYVISDDIKKQNAMIVLEEFEMLVPGIYALNPHNRYLVEIVWTFVDFLVEEFAPEPVWERSLKNQVQAASAGDRMHW